MDSTTPTADSSAPSAAPAVAPAPSKQTGIDIQQALDILSDRSPHDHSGCHAHQTDQLKSMGQTIDLNNNSTSEQNNNNNNENDDPDQKQQQELEDLEQRRKERAAQLQEELKSMTVKELLQTVLETQQQRVATYQGYNQSLTQVLQSANMTAYMSSCAHTTAAFAVLSDTIRAVRQALPPKLAKLITNLQQHEQQKLHLTAAWHLERIRERNENMIHDTNSGDKRIAKLLNQGVQSLQQQLQECVEEINECIEEIRYAMMEEEDNEQE
ncbi:expressed unknown protein [Seminavis robusta]|uniref:Uncharacterized protein n=1 Tax=Seminavis robusta TaxID=568900 RepID=A0A9N8DM13_9STRA|nr:expressed unknown protein [Seminavis robusta]|eukprot:Sro232_g093910.1 n/a (269) ;mRNA; f:46375-47292